MKAKFIETNVIEIELDFQQIYNHVKNSITTNDFKPDKWDICNDFADNIDGYINCIYGYDYEYADGMNDYTIDCIVDEWNKWIDKLDE